MFKIGDKVIITSIFKIKYKGIILEIDSDGYYKVQVDDTTVLCRSSHLELVEEPINQKPPLGVMPENIFILKRAKDLSRAIHEYMEYGTDKYELLYEWTVELQSLLLRMKD